MAQNNKGTKDMIVVFASVFPVVRRFGRRPDDKSGLRFFTALLSVAFYATMFEATNREKHKNEH